MREMEVEEGVVEVIVGADGTGTISYRQYKHQDNHVIDFLKKKQFITEPI